MNSVITILDIIKSNKLFNILEIYYLIYLEEMDVKKKSLIKKKRKNKNNLKNYNMIFQRNIVHLDKIYNLLV